ncbi:AI-2E family transporter [bacterium]|nr:AI-2E family transporter [bacterium]
MLKKFFKPKTIIFIILIICLLFLIPKITGLLLLLFASYIIAAALNPFVNKLEEKLKNRSLSATITVLTSIIALVALILPIVILCYKEVILFISLMPQKAANLYTFMTQTQIYGKTITEMLPLDNIANISTDIAQNILNQSVNFTVALTQMIFILIALTMFVYYILVDKHYLKTKLIEFFPPNLKDKANGILSTITSKVGYYVRAQILSMIAVGVMVGFVVAIMGIDYPILLGLIAGILDIIPLLGPTIALSVIIMIGFSLGLPKIILTIVLFLTAQQTNNYVIKPFLFGKFMKLHPINILVALFIAQEFLGLFGVILSPAIAATICVLVDELYLKPMNAKETGTAIE